MARHNRVIDWNFENDCTEYESNRSMYINIFIDANRFKVVVNRKFIGRSSSLAEAVLMRDNANV
jgi:hypothetical protein